jgi:predicted dehydrogenase
VRLRTLIVGLGSAGTGLHLPVVERLRATATSSPLFAEAPIVLHDPRGMPGGLAGHGVALAGSLTEAARLAPPGETVVHLCTPPSARLQPLSELAALGFRRFLVEKPLALDDATARRIDRLRRDLGLEMVVVAQWLDSSLTRRLEELIRGGALGRLRELTFVQLKPRFLRTLRSPGQATAFEVELPHSVSVALRLAGDARLLRAGVSDMEVGDVVVRHMGAAHVVLGHDGGVVTRATSDLTAPMRERRVELRFTGGRAVGHYAVSREDCHAQLEVRLPGRPARRRVFPDDSLARFTAGAYRRFREGDDLDADLALNLRVAALLGEATRRGTVRHGAPGAQEAADEPVGAVGHAG